MKMVVITAPKTSLHRPEPDPVPRPNRSFFQQLMSLLRGA